MPSEDADFALVVVWWGLPMGGRHLQPGFRDPVAPQEVTTSTQDNIPIF